MIVLVGMEMVNKKYFMLFNINVECLLEKRYLERYFSKYQDIIKTVNIWPASCKHRLC